MKERIGIITLWLLGFSSICIAQQEMHVWVQLNNKNNSPYSLSTPEDFLSERALNRRTAQNIAIRQNDLPVSPSYVLAIDQLDRVTVRHVSKWFNAVSVQLSDSSWIDSILQFPFVDGVQTVKKMAIEPERAIVALPKSAGHSSYFREYYGGAFDQIAMHNGHLLHQLGYTGAGKVIGVMDAGFDQANNLAVMQKMVQENRLLGARDFVDGSNPYAYSRHGTMVLSCMGANQPGSMVGTAPDAAYWLFRTEDVAGEALVEEDNWIAAAEFADSVGVDILNTSLGYSTFENSTQNHSYSDMDGNTTRIAIASDIASAKGMLLVSSAGNNGNKPWFYISTPADADSTIAVAAVQKDSIRAVFSSFGPAADGDLKPNVAALGFGATVALPTGEIATANGTSFSSPILAGMAACLWQALPHLTNMEVKTLIEQNGNLYHQPNFEVGYGIPNFYEAYLQETKQYRSQQNEVLTVYPVPFDSELNILYHTVQSGKWTMELIAANGKVVWQHQLWVAADEFVWTKLTSELSELSAGSYVLRIISGDQNIHQRTVVRL